MFAEFYYFGHTSEFIFNSLGYCKCNDANKAGALQYLRLVNIFSHENLMLMNQKFQMDKKAKKKSRDYLLLILTQKNDYFFTIN